MSKAMQRNLHNDTKCTKYTIQGIPLFCGYKSNHKQHLVNNCSYVLKTIYHLFKRGVVRCESVIKILERACALYVKVARLGTT